MSFNAKKARTKYALPMWVDAFLRDTLELDAAEIGAFNLILWAMWGRESCDLPDDDRKLARVTRVTPQTWKRRIRPTLEQYFEVESGMWISIRLRKEAAKTEKFLAAQSARRSGGDPENDPFAHQNNEVSPPIEEEEKTGKPLELNDPPATGEYSADTTPEHPTQETKRPSIGGGGGDAHARESAPPEIDAFRERILAACGVDPVSGLTGHGGAQLGTKAQMIEAHRWASDLGLSEPEIIDAVERIMARKRDGPPKSLSYFTPSMQRLAAEIAEARTKQMEPQALRPVEGVQTSDQRNQHAPRFSHSGRGGSGNSLASIAARRRLEGQV